MQLFAKAIRTNLETVSDSTVNFSNPECYLSPLLEDEGKNGKNL
jgi:hypothetical protein